MDHWQALFPDAIVTVEYERLVTEPQAEVERLLAAVGLDWNDACLQFHAQPAAVRSALI